jgi:hypothetical protein
MVERFKRGGMEKVSERSRPEYERAFNLVLRHKTKIDTDIGAAPVKSMTTLGVEKIYKALQKGTKVEKRSATSQPLHDPHGACLGLCIQALPEYVPCARCQSVPSGRAHTW